MERYAWSALIVLGLLLLQTTFVPLLSLGGFVPDLLLIWVVFTAIRYGQIEATVTGFVVGLLTDVTTTQFFGLAALSKTVGGFCAGYFYNENKTDQTLGTYHFIMIVLTCSLVHNAVYYLIFFQGAGGPVLWNVIQYSIATAIYTGAISALPMFAFSRRVTT